jgi:hypothetical protein
MADMIATLAVASFAWISSVVGPIGPADQAAPVRASTLDQNQLSSVMRWAQQEDEPPIEQVGEGTNEDVEPLGMSSFSIKVLPWTHKTTSNCSIRGPRPRRWPKQSYHLPSQLNP